MASVLDMLAPLRWVLGSSLVAPVEIVENLDAGLFERFFRKSSPVENLWKSRGYFPQGIYT
ncbi:hypothetical protein [Scytonema sp. PCC 10023]|uniref:hypothetical protein n=1 Tax=Scytonema sp. PCC 10023 TaxID=1680591 RepID=UPI0039C6AAB7